MWSKVVGATLLWHNRRYSGLVSVHPLADYPLVVDVLTDMAEVFAQWREDSVYIAGFAAGGSLAFSCLFWMLARQFRRQAEQNTELETGNLQFDAVLSNIIQGVCLFDAEKRLLVWNARYLEIYSLSPNAIRVGRSLEEIIDYRFAAGSTRNVDIRLPCQHKPAYCRRAILQRG